MKVRSYLIRLVTIFKFQPWYTRASIVNGSNITSFDDPNLRARSSKLVFEVASKVHSLPSIVPSFAPLWLQ